MILAGKVSLVKNQMQDRFDRGITHIEFHSNIDDMNETQGKIELRKMLDENNKKCFSVHAPVFDNDNVFISFTDTNGKVHSNNIEFVKRTIELAAILCNCDSPMVTVHPFGIYRLGMNSYNKGIGDAATFQFIETVNYFDEYLRTYYPHITMNLENMPSMGFDKDSTTLFLGGVEPEFAGMVRKMKLTNVNMLLDICHAETVCRITEINGYRVARLKIEDYIEGYAPSLKNIHLNNLYEIGSPYINHSIPFHYDDGDDMKYLKRVFRKLLEVGYDGYVTVEVQEKDYNKAENHTIMEKSCIIVAKELGFQFENIR